MIMHLWIARNFIYLPIYKLRGENILGFRRDVHAFNEYSSEEMLRIQWEKLKKLLEFVSQHNPYYRKLFEQQNINHKAILHPRDMEQIPFLTKKIINKEFAALKSDGNWRFSSRKTSGSTGIPMRFVKDRVASAYMDALMYEVYGWHGIEMGDRQSRVWGLPFDFKSRMKVVFKDVVLNRKRLVAFGINKSNCLRFYSIVRHFRPKYIYGVVNTICEFARVVSAEGLDPADLGLKIILTTGEILTPRHRSFLQEAFKTRVVNEFGNTENGIVAIECCEGKMHLMNHNLYIEFLDTETQKPAKPGEIGEVVITELHSYGFPFIRYRVGDLARPSNEICPCGIALPVIAEVVGRTSELLVLPDGSRLSSAIVSYALTNGIDKFRTIQKSRERLEILLQVNDQFKDSDLHLIEKRLRVHLGEIMSIGFRIVDTIPVDNSGKLREYVSEIRDDGQSKDQ